MPNCFTLTKIGAKERSLFSDIDDEMREHFGEPPDEKKYLWCWYDTIGLALAMGKSWDDMRSWNDMSESFLKMVDYLEERYTSDCWAEIGRRS